MIGLAIWTEFVKLIDVTDGHNSCSIYHTGIVLCGRGSFDDHLSMVTTEIWVVKWTPNVVAAPQTYTYIF